MSFIWFWFGGATALGGISLARSKDAKEWIQVIPEILGWPILLFMYLPDIADKVADTFREGD